MSKEAMKLALKALKDERDKYLEYSHEDGAPEYIYEAITALEFAVFEPPQKPVAWAMLHDNGHFIDAIHPDEHLRVEGEYIIPLYTTPPQRTWVGLDDTDIGNEYVRFEIIKGGFNRFEYAVRAIEAKLKEKNT